VLRSQLIFLAAPALAPDFFSKRLRLLFFFLQVAPVPRSQKPSHSYKEKGVQKGRRKKWKKKGKKEKKRKKRKKEKRKKKV
jgi:hypothetical protein